MNQMTLNESTTLSAFLQKKFAEIKIKNPSFSLRAFAKKLKLSHGALSEILKGQRQVSPAKAQEILEQLLLDPQERALVSNALNSAKDLNEEKIAYLKLSQDQFQIISEWYHYALLNLIETKDFKNDYAWMSERLGISKTLVIQGLERLKRLNLVEETKKNSLKRTKFTLRTSEDISNVSIKKHHAESLDLAKASLMDDPVERRDITSVTMSINPENMNQAKDLIRKFQDDLKALVQQGSKTEVYKLNIQFIPLTKENEK